MSPVRKLLPAVAPGALSAACGVGLLATSGWLITRASERPPVLSLSIAIGATQAFSLGRGISRYLERLGVHGLSLEMLGKHRLALFDLLEPRVPGSVTGSAALSGLISDADAVAEGFAKGLSATTDVAFSVLFGTLLAAVVEPRLGLVMLAGALAVVAMGWGLSKLGSAAESGAAEERAALAGLVTATVRSARELVVYGREDLLEEELGTARRRSSSLALRSALATGLAKTGAIATAGGALIALLAAGLAARSSGQLSGPALAAVVFATLAVLDQCAGLPAALSGATAGRAARRRIERIAALPAVGEPAPGRSDLGAPGEGAPGEAALERACVVFGGDEILKGVSLRLGTGGRLALTGPSGAGKTTVVHALLRFLVCASGRATLGGTDVTELDRQGIARLAAWLPDETHVFSASLGDNLRLAMPPASDAECASALEKAGLAEWFASLPDGLATRLGAGGRPVSGGEAQRLGLARALLGGAPLLLLDEPTARLDTATAAEILPELLGAAADRSVLVVTHDPGVAGLVDEVVALADGLVASGFETRC